MDLCSTSHEALSKRPPEEVLGVKITGIGHSKYFEPTWIVDGLGPSSFRFHFTLLSSGIVLDLVATSRTREKGLEVMGLFRWLQPQRRKADSTAKECGTRSYLLPTFLARLADPGIRTILLCGCGGGFDFVHSLTLYPELRRLGKTVIIGSYSFGDPTKIVGAVPVFAEDEAIAVRASAANVADAFYGPEVHVCSYLDSAYPASAPHSVYGYYARAFTGPTLARLYRQFIAAHSIDAIVLVDGGSDSLMVGDEEGLGDPIEDAVSVAAVASLLGLKAKVLIVVGLGTDRFHQVSDAASLRAVFELTQAGGFLGAVSLEPSAIGSMFYRGCLEHIDQRQRFRSVLAGTIDSAIQGWFGQEDVPPVLEQRVQPGELFLWPLMAVLWGFDVEAVARRSLIGSWIRDCRSVLECYAELHSGRSALGTKLRDVENLPKHEEMRNTRAGR